MKRYDMECRLHDRCESTPTAPLRSRLCSIGE